MRMLSTCDQNASSRSEVLGGPVSTPRVHAELRVCPAAAPVVNVSAWGVATAAYGMALGMVGMASAVNVTDISGSVSGRLPTVAPCVSGG